MSVNLIFIGCGLPKLGMGWLHIKQTKKFISKAKILGVISPWQVKNDQMNLTFQEFKRDCEFSFYSSVSKLPAFTQPCIAIISGRTKENPTYVSELCSQGVTHIYLEKPGAENLTSLEKMKNLVDSKGVKVMMGYNKNVSRYIEQAKEYESNFNKTMALTFIHNNMETKDTLSECFRRNSEGLLKNMTSHEIALAVSLWGIKRKDLIDIKVHPELTKVLNLNSFIDFSRIGFTLTNNSGKIIKIIANRCSGENDSTCSISDKTFTCPDRETMSKIRELESWKSGMKPYFYSQFDEYIKLKMILIDHVAKGNDYYPEGIVTLDHAIEVMGLCDILNSEFKRQMGY